MGAALADMRISFISMGPFVFRGVKFVRRVLISVIGTTVLLFGIALLVLPGPAFLVIPAGLGILALEFAWARRWMLRAREYYESSTQGARPPAAEDSPPRKPGDPQP